MWWRLEATEMVKASKGFRVKTRHTLRVRPRSRGHPSVTATLQELELGSRVSIHLDGRVHSGMPHPRYQGRTGTIVGTQGRAFRVEIADGKKRKTLLVAPEHLRRG
ncbi:MAG: 50S ribosomal protein L21e [Thermoplasmatota archaeon]